MGFTFIDSKVGNAQGSGTTADTIGTLNVVAGDLLIATAVWYNVNTTVVSIKEAGGGNEMTLLTREDNDMYMVFGYKINATADATADFVMTLTDAATYKFITVLQFRPDADETVTYEAGNFTATGTGTAESSGNISVTGDDILIVGGSANSGWTSIGSEAIANSGADGAVDNTGGASTMAGVWYTMFAENQTNIDADATLAASKPWVCQIIGFKSAAAELTISAAGNITSLETFGTHDVQLRTLVPNAIAWEEGFGTHTAELMLQFLGPSAIASPEALGIPQLNMALSMEGIASSEAFGTTLLTLYLLPSSISSLEAWGTPDLQWVLGPSGIPSTEAFGSLSLALAVTVLPSGVGSAESFGTPVFVKEILPYPAISKEAFGNPEITYLNLIPSGIGSLEAFGDPLLIKTLFPDGIISTEAFGSLDLTTSVGVLPSGIASLENLGSPILTSVNYCYLTGIPSQEGFGSLKVNFNLSPSAIASLEAFGNPLVILGGVLYLYPSGISSAENFGDTIIFRTFTKAIAEILGVKEKILESQRTYSGGKDIIKRILTSIWQDRAKKETVWETTKKIQKDE